MNKSLEQQLKHRNIRPTAMRILVLKTLCEQQVALSLPQLEALFENADKATLYRTLKTFEEHKLIHSINDGTDAVKYAICTETCECLPEELHVHFHCHTCNQTFCLHEVDIPQLNLPKGFSSESINMVVKGVCSNCK